MRPHRSLAHWEQPPAARKRLLDAPIILSSEPDWDDRSTPLSQYILRLLGHKESLRYERRSHSISHRRSKRPNSKRPNSKRPNSKRPRNRRLAET